MSEEVVIEVCPSNPEPASLSGKANYFVVILKRD